MKKNKLKYIYGPVSSWRLGTSLGIDILSQKDKICNFDCLYCQVGKNLYYRKKRKVFISTKEIIKELKKVPKIKIDYITFSGRGEPTLAKNLGNIIKAIKKIRKEPIAVLTNGATINRKDIRNELSIADFVAIKLDAFSQKSLNEMNKPAKGINLDNILKGLKTFKKM